MYIKARYPNQSRAYTFQTPDTVVPGDTVVNSKGSKLTVVDEPVDEGWLETYGADRLTEVKKVVEE